MTSGGREPGQEEINKVLGRGKYTLTFKKEAVRQVKADRTAVAVARTLGMPKGSLSNWVRAEAKGHLGVGVEGRSAPVGTPEQAEIARLRVEVARRRMERDIANAAAAYFAQDVLQGTPGSGR